MHARSSLLVHGDGEVALGRLAGHLTGRVKLAYLDPPYNARTSGAFDDTRSPAEWLALLRRHVEAVHPLLCPSGSLWCEIDDTELGPLQVLLDDVFGRANRLATVTIRRSAATGHKAINPGPVNVSDYLFGYARDRARFVYHPELVARREYDTMYDRFIADVEAPHTGWRIEPLTAAVAAARNYADPRAARAALGRAGFAAATAEFAIAHAANVVRLARVDYAAVSKAARAAVDASRGHDGVQRLQRPGRSDLFLWRGQRILFLADKVARRDDGTLGLVEKLTTIWDDIGFQGIAGEGGVGFPKAKKPERLIRRIIRLGSEPGDLVLDCFAGSGTTGAVALKTGRRFVLVEAGEHAETIAFPRLARVVAGADRTGVTGLEGYRGGGGFRFLRLGGAPAAVSPLPRPPPPGARRLSPPRPSASASAPRWR